MLRLERAKFEHETVVFGVRNFRIIERVIAVVVAFQRFFEQGGASCRRLRPTRCFLRAHLSLMPGQRSLKMRDVLAHGGCPLRRQRHALSILHHAGQFLRQAAGRPQ